MLQFVCLAKHNSICFRIYSSYKYRLTQGNIQAFALANCIKRISAVLTYNCAVSQYKIAIIHAFFQPGYLAFQETSVIVVRYKTDLVTLRFFRQFRISHIGR